MSRNHPDRIEDPLLTSARRILSHEQDTIVTVKPWREIMSKATKEQAAESKAAAKKIAAKGIKPFKHVPGAGIVPEATLNAGLQGAAEAGVDTPPDTVVQSGFSIFTPTTQGTIMTEPTKTKQELDSEAALAKIKTKQDKIDAAAKKKAEAEADRNEKARLKAEAKAKSDAEKAEKAAADRKAREDAAAAAAAEGKTVRTRTYEGSMLALSDRTKQGVYVKGLNGQLRSTDPVAVALEAVPAAKMVGLLLAVLGLEVNPYTALNYGQQSMNLRNRLRGAIRKAAKVGQTEDVISLERLIAIRDEGGYATAEAEAAEKAKKIADAKAAKATADAEKATKAEAAKAAEPAAA